MSQPPSFLQTMQRVNREFGFAESPLSMPKGKLLVPAPEEHLKRQFYAKYAEVIDSVWDTMAHEVFSGDEGIQILSKDRVRITTPALFENKGIPGNVARLDAERKKWIKSDIFRSYLAGFSPAKGREVLGLNLTATFRFFLLRWEIARLNYHHQKKKETPREQCCFQECIDLLRQERLAHQEVAKSKVDRFMRHYALSVIIGDAADIGISLLLLPQKFRQVAPFLSRTQSAVAGELYSLMIALSADETIWRDSVEAGFSQIADIVINKKAKIESRIKEEQKETGNSSIEKLVVGCPIFYAKKALPGLQRYVREAKALYLPNQED